MVKLRKQEQGRSMVEMLGVLAVIGVLSVAGIAGYSIAMRSYRTNEIVNTASMFYIMAMAQNAGNGPTANVGYTDVGGNANPSGVSTLQYNKDDKSITITFTDTNDCTMALNKLGNKASGTCPTLIVNFGETTSTPEEPVDLSGITNKSECESGGYYWMYCGYSNCCSTNGCHQSKTVAKSLCESHNCHFYDPDYCDL